MRDARAVGGGGRAWAAQTCLSLGLPGEVALSVLLSQRDPTYAEGPNAMLISESRSGSAATPERSFDQPKRAPVSRGPFWVPVRLGGSAAAGVVPAARARVAGARALHHAAALAAGRAEVQALHLGRDDGRGVGHCRGRRG